MIYYVAPSKIPTLLDGLGPNDSYSGLVSSPSFNRQYRHTSLESLIHYRSDAYILIGSDSIAFEMGVYSQSPDLCSGYAWLYFDKDQKYIGAAFSSSSERWTPKHAHLYTRTVTK